MRNENEECYMNTEKSTDADMKRNKRINRERDQKKKKTNLRKTTEKIKQALNDLKTYLLYLFFSFETY